jgi:hypothetical protein
MLKSTQGGTMRKIESRLALIALAALFIALACTFSQIQRPVHENQEVSPCDGTEDLQPFPRITQQSVNQFGTKLCDYTITITNNHASKTIQPVIYIHHADGYQQIDESKWVVYQSLAPGESLDVTGNVYIYTDPDATGPLMTEIEQIAGVFDEAECKASEKDSTFLKNVAMAVGRICPHN